MIKHKQNECIFCGRLGSYHSFTDNKGKLFNYYLCDNCHATIISDTLSAIIREYGINNMKTHQTILKIIQKKLLQVKEK